MKRIALFLMAMICFSNYSYAVSDETQTARNGPNYKYSVLIPPKKYQRPAEPANESIHYLSKADIKKACGGIHETGSNNKQLFVIGCSQNFADKSARVCFIFLDNMLENPAYAKVLKVVLLHERAHCHGGWPKTHPMK